MIIVKNFIDFLKNNKISFFTGVPDSILRDFCTYLDNNINKSKHIVSANEGTALGIAAGYNLATNQIPLVYLQNSGLGNLLNPTLSLVDEKVYSIPVIILVGWRGEPGVKDEPQHITQGIVTEKIIRLIKKNIYILKGDQKKDFIGLKKKINHIKIKKKPLFVLVKKDSFKKIKQNNKNILPKKNLLLRETAIEIIISKLGKKYRFISSTGIISRELYELRNKKRLKHDNDFLTVGSMGHASQIAFGIAMNSNKKIVCLDGDGSILMHMGGMATIGDNKPKNLIHICFNNRSHESVGGQKTTSQIISFSDLAKVCGYRKVFGNINTEKKLKHTIEKIKKLTGPIFIECKIKKFHRTDLGRPKEKPIINKKKFMKNI